MKKILILLIVLTSLQFAQVKTEVFKYGEDAVVSFVVPISLGKAANNYSESFDLWGYTGLDSTSFFPVSWRSNDTVQVTIALQTRNPLSANNSLVDGWVDAVVLTSVQANAGNDTLWTKYVMTRGHAPTNTDLVTMGGKYGISGRLRVTFANPTTVGNGGNFRVWVYLKKR